MVLTGCDEDQHLIVGGVQQVPLGLWAHAPSHITHWPKGTSLASLHGGATRPGVTAIRRSASGQLAVTDALVLRDLLGLKRAPEFEAWLQRVGVTGADGRLLPATAQGALTQRLWTLPEPA